MIGLVGQNDPHSTPT